jgi:hypothetical protein
MYAQIIYKMKIVRFPVGAKFIIFQLVASFCLAVSFANIICLTMMDFERALSHGNTLITDPNFPDKEFYKSMVRIFWARSFGVFIAFVLSVIFTVRIKRLWVYLSVIFFIQIIVLSNMRLRNSIYSVIDSILTKVGGMIFSRYGLEYYYLGNGFILLLVGVFVLYFNIKMIRKKST